MPEPIPQASAIPFRRRGEALEFCLITTASGNRWGFPKGIIEGDDSPAATALNEAREEAGLVGRIVGDPLGTYRYQKWGADLDVVVFLMEVETWDDDWQEAELRERIWVKVDEAESRIERPELVALLRRAIDRVIGPERA